MIDKLKGATLTSLLYTLTFVLLGIKTVGCHTIKVKLFTIDCRADLNWCNGL